MPLHIGRRRYCLGVVAAAPLAFAAPAFALECAPRAEIEKTLAQNFNEKPASMGLSTKGSLVVIYTLPAGAWTAVLIPPGGAACVVDVGEGWVDATGGVVAALP